MDRINDSDRLYQEYKQLKAELEREVNTFELARKQHQRRTSQIADMLTRKYFEYQRAAQEERVNERN